MYTQLYEAKYYLNNLDPKYLDVYKPKIFLRIKTPIKKLLIISKNVLKRLLQLLPIIFYSI